MFRCIGGGGNGGNFPTSSFICFALFYISVAFSYQSPGPDDSSKLWILFNFSAS
ncbi:hypothetical protein RchiOBHm_Chr5g0019421 [Rosa chinensis]|uniref:Uncharacterized protein n=1 Tax=Rosa chinensis TaxID=74649 RepID=A0A2P6Q6Z0_ROSCH|nr:hypothetical protein RchiOBHm_Chr5g0019421 [Rosa chinensis]